MNGYVGRRLVRSAVALLLLGSGFASTVQAASSHRAADGVDAARLRVTLTTTSSWARVRFSPGSIAADHVTDQAGRSKYDAAVNTITLSRVVGQASVTTNLVLSETTGASSFQIDVAKGILGHADVTVVNTNGAPYRVASIADSRNDPSAAGEHVDTTVTRDLLMSTTALTLPKAGEKPLVLAAYYPWFDDYSDGRLADRPADPRSVWSPADVKSMTQQAASAGINGFVVSWHGESKDGKGLNLVQHAAEATGQVFTAYLEVPSAKPLSRTDNPAAQVRDWLVQALTRRGSPAFLRAADGVPVVFVYGMDHLSPSQWSNVLIDIGKRRGIRVHLVGDTLDPGYRKYEWGVHRYAVLDSISRLTDWSQSTSLSLRAYAAVDPAARPPLFAGTVSPGFDDHRLRGDRNPVIPRGTDGARYDATWSAALSGDPDWIFVSTWNEWYEDTQVEPGTDTGGTALDQTKQHVALWHG